MPMIGVICGKDGSYQDYDTCITGHQTFDTTRNCNCPVVSIKSMRDNAKHRTGAGISVSTLTSCPRAVAIEKKFDLYENVESGWHKFRGTLTHMLFEHDPDPPPWVVMERRIEYNVTTPQAEVRITGKPDYIDPKYHVLIDFKSKYRVPKILDPMHEAQVNLYRFLIEHGRFCDTQEEVGFTIDRMGIHYVTFNTEKGNIWKKMGVPIWDDQELNSVLQERIEGLLPLILHDDIPACNPFIKNARWKCQCEKYTEQLAERGIYV